MGSGFLRRLASLVRKEVRQMLRDRSNMAVGISLPIIMIVLFGFGISFDLERAPIAVVNESGGACAQALVERVQGSKYFRSSRAGSFAEASGRMRRGEVIGILRIPGDFDRRAAAGSAAVQLVLNGSDAQTSKTLEGYVTGAAALSACAGGAARGSVTVVPRMWFNEAMTSTWFIIPGLITIILTIIGAFLASLLIAREWERGTFEALFVSPVRSVEIVLAKACPYLVIGVIDIALVLLSARHVFHVPIRGSVPVLFAVSLEFLIVSVLMGLLISAVTRSQFLASQLALLTSFMPAVIFSGFIFDLRNMPLWIQPICNALPATHFMRVAKTLFLVGNEWQIVAQGAAILLAYGVAFVWLAVRRLPKRLA